MDSLSLIDFSKLLDGFRELEFQYGYLPDYFFSAFSGKVIFASDNSLFLSGDSIANSMRSYRLRVFDPLSPSPGSSCDGNLVILYLCSLLGVPVSSPCMAVGDSGARLSWGSAVPVISSVAPFRSSSVSSVAISGGVPVASGIARSVASSFPPKLVSSVACSFALSVADAVAPSVAFPVASSFLPVASSVAFSVPPPVAGPVTRSVSFSVTCSVAYSVASSAPSSFSSSFAMSSLLVTPVSSSVSVSCPFSSSSSIT